MTEKQLKSENLQLKKQIEDLKCQLEELNEHHQQTKNKLLTERNMVRRYLDVADVMLIALNINGEITLINRKGCRILDYEEKELLGKNWFNTCIPQNIRYRVSKVFKQLIKGEINDIEYFENPVIGKDGEKILIAWHNSKLKDEKGDVVGVVSSGEDITERKQFEIALKESEGKYRMLAENASDVIWTININLEPTYLSPSIEKLLGFSVEEAMKLTIEKILTSESLKAVLKIFNERLDLEKKGNRDEIMSEPVQLEYKCKDGSTVWAESTISFLRNTQGGLIGFMGVTRDISKRKAAEEKLTASLKEKELLLKEVHHRVKNNMAIISSLLSLQSETINDPMILSTFNESQIRIRSMALVHEKLYQAKDLSKIDFSDYLQGLVHQISKSTDFYGSSANVEIEANDIKMSLDSAIPCGLIISELVTNAFKYAFPNNQKGKILIQIHLIDSKYYKLIVSDNGVGLPDHIGPRNFSSFGLHLVQLLIQQLEGEMEVIRDNGTAFKIFFPIENRL